MTKQMKAHIPAVLMFLIAMGMMVMFSGCTQNKYNIKTSYRNVLENVEITSEIEGKTTPGAVFNLYKKALSFVDSEYLPNKK